MTAQANAKRPRLRTILLYVHLLILALPLAGLGALRIWENELVRRTESELVAQGAFLRAALLAYVESDTEAPRLWEHNRSSHPVAQEHLHLHGERFEYVPSELDLNVAALRGPAPAPRTTSLVAPALLVRAGEPLSAQMREAQRVTLAGMRVVDHRGVVVASSRGEVGLSLAHREEVARALTGEFVRLMRRRISDSPKPPLTSISRASEVRVFVAMPVVISERVVGAVVVSRTPLSFRRALYDNRYVLLSFLVVLLLAVGALTWYTSSTIVRPVRALIEQTRRVEQGLAQGMVPIERPVTQEIAQLSRSIAAMSESLAERAEYIKTFASHVSHEFKTPLTSIRGTAELLTDHLDTMTEQERSRFLTIIDRDAERLQRLVGRLLELARADVLEPGSEHTRPHDALDEVLDAARARGLDITADLPESLPTVRIAATTLSSIVQTLLDNASQHAGSKAKVTVAAAHDASEHTLDLTVTDDGEGVSQANRRKIFTPFFTTARADGGTGLGLSVAASLVEAHGGTLTLDEEKPTTFRIRLLASKPGDLA